MTHHDAMDMLTGFGVVAAMVLFFATAGALVEWWDTTWRIAVEPVRSEIYVARIHSPCLLHSWWWWRSAGCRLI